MTEGQDARPLGVLTPDQQSALKSMADARNKTDASASPLKRPLQQDLPDVDC